MRGFSGGMVLVTLALGVAGCGAVRDAFSPRAETVARANEQTLSVERLGEWAATGKQVPLEPLALSRLSHVWVDYSLFAQALAEGETLRDSTTMTTALWPLISQLKWERFHEQLVARGDLSREQVDSTYRAGELRLFQHILLQVPPNAAADVDAQKRRQAEQLLPRARAAGARFGQLAAQYSDDNGSKTQGGALGVGPRGQFVQAFEDAAWQLAPGAVSNVVKSPFGYHIIRRPPLAEVRDSFQVGVEDRLSLQSDSAHLDSLSTAKRIEPVGRAPALVRAAVQDLDGARDDGRRLVRYRGGSFRVRDFARWLSALDPNVAQALPRANDEQINQFLKAIVQRQLLIEQADSAQVALEPEDWELLRSQHDSAIALLSSILMLTPEMLRDSSATPESRRALAMARVNDYMERVVTGRARFFPVPPFLAEALREDARWSVDEAGVRRALEQAQRTRAQADSLRAPGVPRMTPVPGGSPADTAPRRSVQ